MESASGLNLKEGFLRCVIAFHFILYLVKCCKAHRMVLLNDIQDKFTYSK